MFATPILVFGKKFRRDDSNGVRLQNIYAAKTIAELIRTNLGPRAMLKMLMDPMGGVVMTNDGNAILREIVVQHPVAKMMVEIARTQDEEVGDGTTSVIILTGQILAEVEKHLDTVHPVIVIQGLKKALDDILKLIPDLSKPIDLKNREEVVRLVKACLGTKFLGCGWSEMACDMAIRAVEIVRESLKGKERMDIKNLVRIEKIPGGVLEETQLIEGVVLNKDILHPDMKRCIANPRIVLLSGGLEYRKGESMTNVELMKEGDFTRMLQIEEEQVKKMCQILIGLKPDVVVAEKGISDIAIHCLSQAGITALRRVKKMDITRLSKVCGAAVMSRVEEISEKHIGTNAGKFEVKSIGDEYFVFITECKEVKACTLLLRGPSKDILHEVDRNLHDAMNVVRNIYSEPRVVPGGGAIEMVLYTKLMCSCVGPDTESSPYSAVPMALRVIPFTLLDNTGSDSLRNMTSLTTAHAKGELLGVDGVTGELLPVDKLGVWESAKVKGQIYKTAVETVVQILKIDEILSGTKSKEQEQRPAETKPHEEDKHQDGGGQGDKAQH